MQYKSAAGLAELYDCSKSTVNRRIRLMRKHPERYGGDDIIIIGRLTRISVDAFFDVLKYGDMIENGMTVPERKRKEA